MVIFPLLAVSFFMNVLAVLFVLCCIALILIILVQKGRGGGLSGAFGGAMASGILGSKTGDFLTWVTIGLVGLFLLLAIVLAKYYKPLPGQYQTVQPTAQTASPSVTTEPATAADGNETGSTINILPSVPAAEEPVTPGEADSTAPQVGETGDANMQSN